MKKKKHGVFHLNGNTGWVTVCLFLIAQTTTSVYWGGKISAEVTNLKISMVEIKATAEVNRIEVKEDIKDLEQQLRAQQTTRRSA